MGHKVDHRTVTLGEDLSQYNEVVVYLFTPETRVSIYTYEALYTISQHPKCILAVDDWRVANTYNGITKNAVGDDVFKPFILQTCDKKREHVEPYHSHFQDAFNVILAKRNRLLISAFSCTHLNDPINYGPHLITDKISYPRGRVFSYNPNPYHLNRTLANPNPQSHNHADPAFELHNLNPNPTHAPLIPHILKSHRFNFATLTPSLTTKWLHSLPSFSTIPYTSPPIHLINTWRIDLYGSGKVCRAKTRSPEQPSEIERVSEAEMIKRLTYDWCCLMPGYEHAGSGWWRARPLQVADAGSVLMGDEREMKVLFGSEYPYYGLTAEGVTKLAEDDLRDLAECQRQCLYRVHPLDKRVQMGELEVVLRAER